MSTHFYRFFTVSLALSILALAGCVKPPPVSRVSVAYARDGDAVSAALAETFRHTNVLARYQLQATVTSCDSGTPFLDAVIHDAPDLCLGTGAVACTLFDRGFSGWLIATGGPSSSVALAGPVGAKPPDVEHASILMARDGAAHAAFLAWAAASRLPLQDAHLAWAPPAEVSQRFNSGKAPWAAGWADTLRRSGMTTLFQTPTTQVVLASQAFLNRDREAGERFVAACTDAWFFVAGHPREVDAWVQADGGFPITPFRAASIHDVKLDVEPDTVARLSRLCGILSPGHAATRPGDRVDNDLVERSHARFKGYFDPNATRAVQ